MSKKIYSLILDIFQVSTIVVIAFTGPLLCSSIILIVMQIIAIFIMTDAAWEMRRTKYYRFPDVGRQKELVKTGVYKFIRNPMYLSELLFTGALVLNMFNFFRWGMFFILFVDLLLKIKYEEALLGKHFKEFNNYIQNSWKLIPFLY